MTLSDVPFARLCAVQYAVGKAKTIVRNINGIILRVNFSCSFMQQLRPRNFFPTETKKLQKTQCCKCISII